MGVELKITDCGCFWLPSLSHLACGLGHSLLVKVPSRFIQASLD